MTGRSAQGAPGVCGAGGRERVRAGDLRRVRSGRRLGCGTRCLNDDGRRCTGDSSDRCSVCPFWLTVRPLLLGLASLATALTVRNRWPLWPVSLRANRVARMWTADAGRAPRTMRSCARRFRRRRIGGHCEIARAEMLIRASAHLNPCHRSSPVLGLNALNAEKLTLDATVHLAIEFLTIGLFLRRQPGVQLRQGNRCHIYGVWQSRRRLLAPDAWLLTLRSGAPEPQARPVLGYPPVGPILSPADRRNAVCAGQPYPSGAKLTQDAIDCGGA